jgi:hypothetical protein
MVDVARAVVQRKRMYATDVELSRNGLGASPDDTVDTERARRND